MATYVTLYKLTDQGAKDIKNAPARIESGIKAAEAAGIKVLGFYAVAGEYDYIGVYDVGDEMLTMAQGLAIVARGNVRTVTMRAYTRDEFAAIVGMIP